MKKRLTIKAIALACLLGACKKDGNGLNGGGIAITDDNGAEALFFKINTLWSGTLGPALTHAPQSYTNKVLNGSSGTATVNGQYRTTNASSSFSSTTTSNVDVTITFKDYVADGMHLNGTVCFFYDSEFRNACSDYGCASSSHTSQDYESKSTSGSSLGPVNVQFDYAGKGYKDAVTMDMSKSDNAHWAIKVTNSANQTINTSY